MTKRFLAVILLAAALLVPLSASAAPIKAFISSFTVTPQENAGLKETLQRLFAMRLAGDGVSTVDSPAEAQVVVQPSYTQIGKVFSLDAVAKLGNGQTVASAYEQGEGQDDLIPALGRLSAKLRGEIVKQYGTVAAPPAPVVAAPAAAPRSQATQGAPAPQALQAEPGATLWMSQRLDGAQTSVAPAGTVNGARAIFMADPHSLRVYRQDQKLVLLAEAELPRRGKVLAVDSTGRESDGGVRAYVTIIDGDAPSSRIYSFENGKLRLVADKVPYMFRAVGLSGGPAKIYAQEMGRSEDYYGDVYEVADRGVKVELGRAIKMPRYGNVFNFNTFTDASGKTYFLVYSPDRYLIVYSDSGEELWRSPDKFGGSQTYFQREISSSARPGEDNMRWIFIDQPITVTGNGDIIVPQNEGFLVVGNHRSFTKYNFTALTWNGSSLEERWKTKETQNYLADYFFAPEAGQFVCLEVVQKEGAFSRGASAVRVIRGN